MTGPTTWLASYPKSGSTWFRAVCTALQLGTGPDVNRLGGGDLPAQRKLFDSSLGLRSSDLSGPEIAQLRPRADEIFAATHGSPRWRKVHDAFRAAPSAEPVVSVVATRSTVYLVRDPRDVAVSLAHHTDKPTGTVVDFMCSPRATVSNNRAVLEPQLPQHLGTWSHHVRSWTGQGLLPVHVARYEDCLANPLATFGAALRAGGVEFSEEELRDALEQSTWQRLRGQEDQAGFRERHNRHEKFFRQGTAGGWREEPRLSGTSTYALGEQTGTESIALTVTQMPAHNHSVQASDAPASAPHPGGAVMGRTQADTYAAAPDGVTTMNSGRTSTTGGGVPISVLQPLLAVNFCIALQGIYPSRN